MGAFSLICCCLRFKHFAGGSRLIFFPMHEKKMHEIFKRAKWTRKTMQWAMESGIYKHMD
jgi:hypothetical protein